MAQQRHVLRARCAMSLLRFILVCGVLAGCTAPRASAEPVTNMSTQKSAVEKAYAEINGIRLYYEVHGSAPGTPLVLLNGGGSTIEVSYGQVLPLFAEHRRVIALDEQNHGRSGHRDVPER